MTVSYGFYNSVLGDRRYNTTHISEMFNNLIIDGIFGHIGTSFIVQAAEGLTVNVGIGRAWFNSTWTVNDAILPLEAPAADTLLHRIDAIVIEVNAAQEVRANSIKFVTGNPSSSPSRPTMANEKDLHQYALCYIYRQAGSTSIRQADITNMVGTPDTPLVSGVLQTFDLNQLLGHWEDELDRFVSDEETSFKQWFADRKAELLEEQAFLDQWISSEQKDFLAWFQEMKGQLSTDSAGNLQLQIDKEEVDRILISGFVDGQKVFSEDGTIITSTATDGRKLIKTFSNGFLTMSNILQTDNGREIARMVKTFSTDGRVISTIVTYIV